MLLNLRSTRQFADGYAHMDKWEEVGSMEDISSKTVESDDGEDLTEPRKTTLHTIITSKADDEKIKAAIYDTFTVSNCKHEYDCCGCRSFRVTSAKRVTGDLWCVEIGSSRNY
jgi:hypothetical protein